MKLSPLSLPTLKYMRSSYLKAPTYRQSINFRANTNNKPEEETPKTEFVMDCSRFYQSPMIILRNQLLQDGFTLEELKGWYVPDETNPEKIDSQKSKEDIEAMIRTYDLIKKKYVNDDVLADMQWYDEMSDGLDETYEGAPRYRGIDNFKDEIMALLSYLNRHNAPVVKLLMDDEDFLNSEINAAIWGMRTQEDVQNGLEIYHYAKARGFYKEFSYPLAVCMSEANGKNMELIKKAVKEENFLTENDDFTLTYLAKFLRMDNELTRMYLENEDMTLEDVEYFLEQSDS